MPGARGRAPVSLQDPLQVYGPGTGRAAPSLCAAAESGSAPGRPPSSRAAPAAASGSSWF